MIFAAAACVTAAGLPAISAQAAEKPVLRLITASKTATADRYEGEPAVYLNLGAYIAADRPWELRVKRPSYARKPVVYQRIGGKDRKLPAGLVDDFSGLPDFLKLSIRSTDGKIEQKLSQTFCPLGPSSRIKKEAVATNKYPDSCSYNPFTLGSVWGIQKGWAVNTASGYYGPAPASADLPAGTYDVAVSVAKKYRKLFRIGGGTKHVRLTVRLIQNQDAQGRKRAAGAALKAVRPTGKPRIPKGPRPDLRALPAYGIAISQDETGAIPMPPMPGMPTPAPAPAPAVPAPVHDYLQFAANVWNAGPSPLIVDGFRRGRQGLMDGYQYFYDTRGKQVGYQRTGQFEWDPRPGHEHWHFKDFATYRLLGADRKLIVRSQKEAFCLAATDAIDLTVKGAKWKPSNTDLATACGDVTSLSVREVLDVGQGDTYTQTLPGQSFDISALKNGTYYIQVIANPKHRLIERSTGNNVSYRKVILGGVPGARTVRVPKVGIVDAP
ncbi:hypothetical protein GCM10010468_11750 [Actinocorallia longicatena]|uniref:Lysyl oxidase n=2 Tax=Actinocorallia longicatena TaxID=111803 RepID=A0ABP6Q0Y0_9ACTN